MRRPLRVGDRVTAEGEVVEAVTTANLGPDRARVRFFGTTSPVLIADDALVLIERAEPPVGSVVVKDGLAFMRMDNGAWYRIKGEVPVTWPDISDGDVIHEPGGE